MALRRKREPVDRGAQRIQEGRDLNPARMRRTPNGVVVEKLPVNAAQPGIVRSKDVTPESHNLARPVVAIDESAYTHNISWRAHDFSDDLSDALSDDSSFDEHHTVLADMGPMVKNILDTGDPAGFNVRAVESLLARGPGMLDQLAPAYLSAADAAYQRFDRDFIRQNDTGRETYLLDGMALIDEGFDRRAEEESYGQGDSRDFQTMRNGFSRAAELDKHAFVRSVEELMHPGSMRNLDARIEHVASTFENLYADRGREVPQQVHDLAQTVRSHKCVDEQGVDYAKENQRRGSPEVRQGNVRQNSVQQAKLPRKSEQPTASQFKLPSRLQERVDQFENSTSSKDREQDGPSL